MKKISYNIHSFFAAANSFDGFKSNFPQIFDGRKFDRIYILKGGPGTGKSTLMRKVGHCFEKPDIDITYIYCSSDTKSLDGVIIKKENMHYAIIDGTSPHMTDPLYPGAVEVLVNLGEGFDTQSLSRQKEKIIELNTLKSEAYKSAYKFLSLAGNIFNNIFDVFYNSDVYSKAEKLANEILKNNIHDTIGVCTSSDYLVGAYGKDGYVRLDLPCIKKEYISLTGDGFTEYAVIREIKKALAEDRLTENVFYSPLTTKMIDAVITPDMIISTDRCGYLSFDTESIAGHLPYEYTVMCGFYRDAMEMSRNRFAKASEFHFMLEEIYSQNIDFSHNEKLTRSIIEEISESIT